MHKKRRMSIQTRANWLIDAAVFVGGLLAALSSIYFLFLPVGGYQGGRNPYYGITILFDRHTWDAIHTWGGILMIAAVILHLVIHWRWIKMMARRMIKGIRGQGTGLSKGGKLNVIIDALIAASFTLAAVSGVYFLFAPTGGHQGGTNPEWYTSLLFSRTTWDLIHTWSGTVMIVAALAHLWIHWRWVVNVTKRFFLSLWPRITSRSPEVLGSTAN